MALFAKMQRFKNPPGIGTVLGPGSDCAYAMMIYHLKPRKLLDKTSFFDVQLRLVHGIPEHPVAGFSFSGEIPQGPSSNGGDTKEMNLNGVPMARYGLRLSQEEAASLRKVLNASQISRIHI